MLLETFLVDEVLDHVMRLFRPEMRLLVGDVILALSSTLLFVLRNLIKNVLLVGLIGLELELALGLFKHLFLFDVAEELVALVFALILQVSQVVFEPVVGSLAGFAFALVRVLTLTLHMAVDSVRTLRIHHERISRVESIGDVLAVERAADHIVQLAVAVAIESTVVRDTIAVVVEVNVHGRRDASVRLDQGSAVAGVHSGVAHVLHAG